MYCDVHHGVALRMNRHNYLSCPVCDNLKKQTKLAEEQVLLAEIAIDDARRESEWAAKNNVEEGVCECCGQKFVDGTRKFPLRGKIWTNLLSEYSKTGVCPKCYNNYGRMNGFERDWNLQERIDFEKKEIQLETERKQKEKEERLRQEELKKIREEEARRKREEQKEKEEARKRQREQEAREKEQREREWKQQAPERERLAREKEQREREWKQTLERNRKRDNRNRVIKGVFVNDTTKGIGQFLGCIIIILAVLMLIGILSRC